ncbi:MAG: VWA domain-containing protein [Planctomycetota bacterium]
MTTFAFLSLTTPAMLWGAALVAGPVAAHLLTRRARRRVVFPSVALLVSAAAGSASGYRLRRWVLLVLRCLIVLAVVAAFVRPTWTGSAGNGATAAPAGGATTSGVVVVLDLGVSTTRVAGDGRAVAERLRGLAGARLAALRSGRDGAGVVLADASPGVVFERVSRNLAALREAVAGAEPTEQRADLPAAVTRAGRLLGDAGDEYEQRRVVVFTDGQRSDWEDAGAVRLPAGVGLEVVTVGDDRPWANVSLSAAGVTPSRPRVGEAVELGVDVSHTGDAATRVRVDLFLDGAEVDTKWASLPRGGRQRVGFTRRLERAGAHRVRFVVDADDELAADDEAVAVVRTEGRRAVVVVGDGLPDRAGTAGYFITRALAPRGDARDRYRVTHVAGAEADDAALAGAALVVVGDLRRTTGEAEEALGGALRRYAEAGGAVLVFAGSSPLRGATEVLPWSWGPRLASARVDGIDTEAALLADLDGAAREALRGVRLRRAWRVSEVGDGAAVLMRFRGGAPALAERPVGKGRVVVAAFSPSAETGPLGKEGVFVALLHGLAGRLSAGGPSEATAYAGRALTIPADAWPDPSGVAAVVRTPGGGAALDGVVSLDFDNARLDLAAAARRGFYVWTQGPAELGVAAVNLDPRESDPRTIDPEVMAAELAAAAGAAVSVGAAATASKEVGGGRPLWGVALLLAMALLCVEMGLLGRWRK